MAVTRMKIQRNRDTKKDNEDEFQCFHTSRFFWFVFFAQLIYYIRERFKTHLESSGR